MPTPVYEGEAGFHSALVGRESRLRLKVYPLQRVAGALLLTVDFTPISDGGSAGRGYFNNRVNSDTAQRWLFSGSSLIDAVGMVRYGPLRDGSIDGAVYSSPVGDSEQKAEVMYRGGVFFPDPGPSASRLSVDLQLGGVIPDVPISGDSRTAPGLVHGLPDAQPAPERSDLVTWAVEVPPGGAFVDRHELVAKVAGGTVNEGVGAQGLVSVNADVLFAFDSATVSSAGSGLVRQTASILVAKADPEKPVVVTGYTDAKGASSYNAQLSGKRAAAVVAALKATGTVGGLALRAQGRGEKDPVAANTRPGGADNPQGRALNRRVEISYTPKAAPSVTPSTSVAVPATSGDVRATAGQGEEGSVRLPRASLPVGGGGAPGFFDPVVSPVVRDGNLSLVRFQLTLEGTEQRNFESQLTAFVQGNLDIGDVRVIDQATGRAYIPAFDRDKPERVLCTYVIWMDPGVPFRFSVYVAGLPASVNTVSVSLGSLGTATGVPVRG